MSTNLSPAKGNAVAQDASASPPYRFWLSVALLAATVMQVLDITIVSVALPYMAGSLSANTSQISWVVTSYLVAAAISTPLTGFLAARWGRRRLLLASLGGFVVVSGLCGVSQDLMEIVFLRLLQGLVGAPLPSLAQAMLIEAYPPEMRGRITARWSLAVVAGPILGPVIGGILVTHLDWRWVFYVNLPAGLLAWMLVYRFSSPSTTIEKRRIDLLGFASMAIGLGALQVVLDQGNTMGWFSSQRIVILTMLVVLTLSLFLWRALTRDDSIVHLRLLRNRDFGIASLASITFGAGFYGIVTYQPIFLEHLLGYPPETAGWISAARGITAMLGMLITGRLIHRTGPLVWALTGCVISAVGGYAMTGYDLHIGLSAALWPGILQGTALSGSRTKAPGFAGRYLLLKAASLPSSSTTSYLPKIRQFLLTWDASIPRPCFTLQRVKKTKRDVSNFWRGHPIPFTSHLPRFFDLKGSCWAPQTFLRFSPADIRTFNAASRILNHILASTHLRLERGFQLLTCFGWLSIAGVFAWDMKWNRFIQIIRSMLKSSHSDHLSPPRWRWKQYHCGNNAKSFVHARASSSTQKVSSLFPPPPPT